MNPVRIRDSFIPAVRATNEAIPLKKFGKGLSVGNDLAQVRILFICMQKDHPADETDVCFLLQFTKGEKMKNKKTTLIAAIVLVVVLVAAGLLYMKFKPGTTAGSKEITVKVSALDAGEETFTYQTDEEFLGAVLTANELIEGEDGQYGLFITAVNGVKADDSKQQWWCITKGGEQVNTSADQTPIADGDQFELTLTEGY